MRMMRIASVLLIGLVAWAFRSFFNPPPPNVCDSPGGPPVTSLRIKLKDGRHLAYKEYGVPKDLATHRIVFVHPFASCRHDVVIATNSTMDFIEREKVYIVSFDRPGYGESDPNPTRTVESFALDIEQLAYQLKLGTKFYIVGFSMGGQAIWGCLKYIPHRLAGAALLAPVVNYWWPGFPSNLSTRAYNLQPQRDRWALRIVHYVPWLTFWWNTRNWFPAASAIHGNRDILSRQDFQLLPKMPSRQGYLAQIKQQGEFESIHRDMIIGFGNWEFDPMDLKNPFPNNEGSVHLWQGDDDKLVPFILQTYIAKRLPWIHYHVESGGGHMFPHSDGTAETILKTLLHIEK